MLSRAEIKEKAKSMIDEKSTWEMFAPILINIAITAVLGGLSAVIGVTALLIPLSQYIFICWQFKFLKTRDAKLDNYFRPLKDIDWLLRIVVTTFLVELFTALGLIVFIIPGVIFSYSFAMVPFIMADSKKYSFMDALKFSRKLMKGHKFEYFKLQLSFIGWFILISLTAGILLIWKGQYIELTFAIYYKELKKEYKMNHPEEFLDEKKKEDVKEDIIEGEIIEEVDDVEDVF